MKFLSVMSLMWVTFCLDAAASTNRLDSAEITIDANKQVESVKTESQLIEDELDKVSDNIEENKSRSKLYKKGTRALPKLNKSLIEAEQGRYKWNKGIELHNKIAECSSNYKNPECRKILGLDEIDREEREEMEEDKVSRHSSNEVEQKVSYASSSVARSYKTKTNKLSMEDYIDLVDGRFLNQQYFLDSCYKNVPEFKGAIHAQIKITANGKLDHIGIEEVNSSDARLLVNCVAQVIRNVKFPVPPNRKRITIRKSFRFDLI